MFRFSTSKASSSGDPALELRIEQARIRTLFEMVPSSMFAGLLAAVGVVWVLHNVVPTGPLNLWLAARAVMALLRSVHTFAYRRAADKSSRYWYVQYAILASADSLAWGALGWAITPVHQTDVAAVSLSVLTGVVAVGTFMLHMDVRVATLFIVPILLPNSAFALTRHDEFGWFCSIALSGFMALLLLEARRSNQRICELLRLRFQSEQVSQAQAQALHQAQLLSDAKSRFVATMSHEMRTPLHGILGLARLLSQRANDPQTLHQLDLIRGSGEHLVNVINDVLDYSSVEAGGLPLHEKPFDLHALLNEVAETSAVSAMEKGLTLDVELGVPLKHDVIGDPVRLRQILHNLLGNAIKFTPTGFVRLRAHRDSGCREIVVEVEDSGIGIASAEQARVFEAFHQAEGTYQRRFGGTGLGLTISRELCRAMGGELSCRSKPGEGSVFTFMLPLPEVDAPQQTTVALAARAHQVEGHVLLVEDNPVNALVAEAELHNMGLTVTLVSNGRDALEWLEGQRADVVLMDCEMPELDGFEATRLIRERERHVGRAPVRIIALTANGHDTYRQRCLHVGMNDHLAKPFRPDDLRRTLWRHLRKVARPGASMPAVSATLRLAAWPR